MSILSNAILLSNQEGCPRPLGRQCTASCFRRVDYELSKCDAPRAALFICECDANYRVLGDATDSGLLRFCDQLVDVDATRAAFSSVYAIPFNSKNKWALTMVVIPGDDENYLAMIKGAPEYVLQRCKKFQYKGKVSIPPCQFCLLTSVKIHVSFSGSLLINVSA